MKKNYKAPGITIQAGLLFDNIAQGIKPGSVDEQLTKERDDDAVVEKKPTKKTHGLKVSGDHHQKNFFSA